MSSPRPEDHALSRAAIVFAIAALFALIWPVYSWFGGIFPLILGLPVSMFYIAAVISVVFSVMLALFLWEDRNGRLG